VAPELRLLADYHQLHVFDEGSTTDLGLYWTDRAWVDALAAGDDAAAVGCVVNVFVRVDVEILNAPAVDDAADFDHVVEASIQVPSGRLVVMGCTDYQPDAARFAVAPGSVRLRVSRSNLDVAAQLDIDSDKSPATMERVRIQIWPAPSAPLAVLKRWRADRR
jgi:hypothetical protein